MKQEVSNKIIYFNWIMALCVVYHHWHGQFFDSTLFSEIQPVSSLSLQKWNEFLNNLGGMVVSYFFMMSGLLLYRDATKENIWNKVKRRLYSLGAPFLLWNTIIIIYTYVMFRKVCFSDWRGLLLGFSLTPFDGPLWYMLVVLVFSFFAPLVIKEKDNKLVLTIVLVSLALVSGVLHYMVMPKYVDSLWFGWYWNRILSYVPLYIIGCYVGMYYDKTVLEERYNKPVAAVIALATVIICVVVFWMYGDENSFSILMQRIQAIALWFLLPGDLFKWKPALPFKTSVIIYAMHEPILIPLTNSWVTSAWMNGVYNLAGHIFISFAAVVVLYLLCVVLIYAMKLVLNEKVFAALSGGRVS